MSVIDVSNLQQVSSYNTLLAQNNLINNVYFLNETDVSGYVFEINAFDTSGSLTIDPTFDTQIQQGLGLDDCSAIALLDVSLSEFNQLFTFQSDSDDLDDLSVNDLKFGVMERFLGFGFPPEVALALSTTGFMTSLPIL